MNIWQCQHFFMFFVIKEAPLSITCLHDDLWYSTVPRAYCDSKALQFLWRLLWIACVAPTCLFSRPVASACRPGSLAFLPFCLFASSPPSLPLYLSLECRCLVKITLAMPCYANDYQLSTCIPLLLQQLPIQTCQKKCLSCIIDK